jgi:hypothetical protein
MKQLRDAFVNLIQSDDFKWNPDVEREEKIIFSISDLPFEFNSYERSYTINHLGIAYRMGEKLAERLCRWHTKQYQKTKLTYPDSTAWYNSLSEAEKKRVKRWDYQNKKWL